MRISVVICTYNRAKFIRSCLEHIFNQSLPKSEYEVIVVNNNCTDGTKTIVDEFIAEHYELDIKQVTETNQGLSFARNRGIKEAKYELISYIDDDGEANCEWLNRIRNHFLKNNKLVGIGGKVLPIYETSEPNWLSYHTRMMVTHIDYGDKVFKCYGKKYPAGCNMTYSKDTLLKTSGFNESLKWRVDDKHIFYEVSKISNEIYYFPDLIVYHNIDKSRISDESFNLLSKRLGQEEKLRTLDLGWFHYFLKIINYTIILGVSLIYYIGFTLKGENLKGIYLVRFRYLALKALISG